MCTGHFLNWITLPRMETSMGFLTSNPPPLPPVGVVTCVWTQHKLQWQDKSRKLILTVRPANLPRGLWREHTGKGSKHCWGHRAESAVNCQSWTHSEEDSEALCSPGKWNLLFLIPTLGLLATNHSLALWSLAVPALPILEWRNLAALSVLLKRALFPCWFRLTIH